MSTKTKSSQAFGPFQQTNFSIPPVQSVIDHSAPSSSSICTCKILRSNFFLSIIFRLGLEPSRQTSSTRLPGQLSRAHTKTKSILLVTARREKKWLFPAAQFCIRITTAELLDSNAKKKYSVRLWATACNGLAQGPSFWCLSIIHSGIHRNKHKKRTFISSFVLFLTIVQ